MASLTWHFSVKSNAKDKPIVVLLHNFAGTEDNFGKHIHLLNDLAYDVVTFDLSWHKHGPKKIFTNFIRKVWADEIKDALCEAIKERPIITFAFSGPSYSMIDAVSILVEHHADKIKGMIFDSGPFEHHGQCVKNMLKLHYKIKSDLLVEIFTTGLVLAWDPWNSEHTQNSLKKIFAKKADIPILSLQGALDRIVPVEYIQELFKKAQPRNFVEVVFEKGSHLTLLKEEPEKYREVLLQFFSKL